MKKKMVMSVMVASMVFGGVAIAHEGATGVIKERMEMMGVMKNAMKVLVPMMKGEVDYDAAAVREQAKNIQSVSGEVFTSKFPEGSLMHPSEAKEEIWTNWAEFTKLSVQMQDAGKALELAADTKADAMAAFGNVGKTCGACHSQFRVKK
ncbi:MAG: cytochrome c [Alphaproteobacteria bacterium]|nr:cytochrome c [Alphaproteobacteria bacterium]